MDRFKLFMSQAHQLLALEIASVPEHQKKLMQRDLLNTMISDAQFSTARQLAPAAAAAV